MSSAGHLVGGRLQGLADEALLTLLLMIPLNKGSGDSPHGSAAEWPRRPPCGGGPGGGPQGPAGRPSPCLADARGSQEWSAWSQCPAVRAALRMGFGRSQVQQLVQQKYRWAVPASVSASQLVADLLQEEDGGCPAEARGAPLPPALPRCPPVPGTQLPRPLLRGRRGMSRGSGLGGSGMLWEGREGDPACGPLWVGFHFPWGLWSVLTTYSSCPHES